MKNVTTAYRFSPSTLNLFLNCPRCFWLQFNKGIQRPRGIFPSLPGGMDRVIKDYYNGYRKIKKLPPELEGKVEGLLFEDGALLEEWRNWRKGLVHEDKALGVTLTGALDECLVKGDYYIPLDYKTKGSAPNQEDSEKYYQNQLDCYCLLLESNRRPTCSLAYLVYYYPEKVQKNGLVQFKVEPIRMETDPLRAKETVEKAAALLRGPMPTDGGECEYCGYTGNFEK